MIDWEPIHSAPKDGRVVLLWSRGDYYLGSFMGAAWMQKDGYAILTGDMGPPTHWAPLSPPPGERPRWA